MGDSLVIPIATAPVTGEIRPPGSKSITNRAFVCAALARGQSRLTGALDSDDTRVMAAGLASLGAGIKADWAAGIIDVAGTHGTLLAREATIDCAASGTTMRFLSAVCGLGHGIYRLDGTSRMRQRPIGDLVAALRDLGIDAVAESPGECPPVAIRSRGMAGGSATVRGDTSSQFASGLALAAPCTSEGMEIAFTGELVSLPYLDMTRRVMEAFGATCTVMTDGRWKIPPRGYDPRVYAIEPDASAASYFTAAAAITGGSVRIEGLGRSSLQGDVAFCDALERMGCVVEWEPHAVTVSGRAIHGVEIDMNSISDTVPTLAVVALFARGKTTIRNVAHVRDKETDRISDLVRELRRIGGEIEEHPDGLTVCPTRADAPLHAASVKTYDDHRIAMSLALAGLTVSGVEIQDPRCVGKTFPGYWRALANLARFPATFHPPA